jgi:hypothetical protein
MALTLTQKQAPTAVGGQFRTHYSIACDTSYPTGGYALAASSLGFGNAANTDPDLIVQVEGGTKGYQAYYDYTNQKLIFYTSAGTQTAATTDLSSLTDVRVVTHSKFRG